MPKTLIFISDADGIAFLAYLLAGLAGFCGLLSQFIYSTKGFNAVLWGKQVMIITYQSTQFIECLPHLPGLSSRGISLGAAGVPGPLRPACLLAGDYLFAAVFPMVASSWPSCVPSGR